MLSALLKKLFYHPKFSIYFDDRIQVDDTAIILRSARFRFDIKNGIQKIRICKNSVVGCEFVFESRQGHITIGENTFINSGTKLISREKIIIGNNVIISWGCTIYDHNSHSLDHLARRADLVSQFENYGSGNGLNAEKEWSSVSSAPIVIGDDVWLGMDVKILKGVTIGEGAVIGAGSVVRSDVKPWTVMMGNPAQKVKDLR